MSMSTGGQGISVEEQIEQWRSYLRGRQAIHTVDVVELEDHLREQIAGLEEAGLAADEAFLVAVKRMGDLDTLSREFAREHLERLWKQLVVSGEEGFGDAAAKPCGISRGKKLATDVTLLASPPPGTGAYGAAGSRARRTACPGWRGRAAAPGSRRRRASGCDARSRREDPTTS